MPRHSYHILTSRDYGYQMADPASAVELCETIFDHALHEDKYTSTGLEQERWYLDLTEQAARLRHLLSDGNTWGIGELHLFFGLKIREIKDTGAGREIILMFGNAVTPDGRVTETVLQKAIFETPFTPSRYADGSASFTTAHVDAIGKLKGKNRNLSFTTTLWRSETDAQRTAPLGTLYESAESGAHEFTYEGTRDVKEPWAALDETSGGNNRNYTFDESKLTKISACGQVLFSAATPHRAPRNVVEVMQTFGVKRRFNIQFQIKPNAKRGAELADQPFFSTIAPQTRMFRVFPGAIPEPRWITTQEAARAASAASRAASAAVAAQVAQGDDEERLATLLKAAREADKNAKVAQDVERDNPLGWVAKTIGGSGAAAAAAGGGGGKAFHRLHPMQSAAQVVRRRLELEQEEAREIEDIERARGTWTKDDDADRKKKAAAYSRATRDLIGGSPYPTTASDGGHASAHLQGSFGRLKF